MFPLDPLPGGFFSSLAGSLAYPRRLRAAPVATSSSCMSRPAACHCRGYKIRRACADSRERARPAPVRHRRDSGAADRCHTGHDRWQACEGNREHRRAARLRSDRHGLPRGGRCVQIVVRLDDGRRGQNDIRSGACDSTNPATNQTPRCERKPPEARFIEITPGVLRNVGPFAIRPREPDFSRPTNSRGTAAGVQNSTIRDDVSRTLVASLRGYCSLTPRLLIGPRR